ncbi:MAG: tetratricopeptide repeat protein [Planctomycetota bacterium]
MADERLQQLEKMLDDNPNDTFCLYGIAHEHAKAGRLDQALVFFDRTLEVDPDYCYAYYHKARTLDDDGQTDEALKTALLGLQRATAVGDAHAAAELDALRDELE